MSGPGFEAKAAIESGEVATLQALLAAQPSLASARPDGQRTLLHFVADWPGHWPNGAESVRALVTAGADVNARFGGHGETPLMWAASSDDVAVLDALLDAGADINLDGAVIADGTALADARAFGQWNVGRRLIERGATTTIEDAAAFGLLDRLTELAESASAEDLNRAFWYAAHGGQRAAAEWLWARGVDVNWLPPWERLTPLDTAEREQAGELAQWLRSQGGCRAADLPPDSRY